MRMRVPTHASCNEMDRMWMQNTSINCVSVVLFKRADCLRTLCKIITIIEAPLLLFLRLRLHLLVVVCVSVTTSWLRHNEASVRTEKE